MIPLLFLDYLPDGTGAVHIIDARLNRALCSIPWPGSSGKLRNVDQLKTLDGHCEGCGFIWLQILKAGQMMVEANLAGQRKDRQKGTPRTPRANQRKGRTDGKTENGR